MNLKPQGLPVLAVHNANLESYTPRSNSSAKHAFPSIASSSSRGPTLRSCDCEVGDFRFRVGAEDNIEIAKILPHRYPFLLPSWAWVFNFRVLPKIPIIVAIYGNFLISNNPAECGCKVFRP